MRSIVALSLCSADQRAAIHRPVIEPIVDSIARKLFRILHPIRYGKISAKRPYQRRSSIESDAFHELAHYRP